MSDDSVVTLDDVHVHFESSRLLGLAGSETVRAVDGVSLEISEGDVIALVGESGCGKTTLGKTVIGVQRPTEGSVHYRGQDLWETKDRSSSLFRREKSDAISFTEIRRSLQMIHQDPGSSLNSNYTIESLLADPLKKWSPELDPADRRARIYGFLDFVGMSPPENYAHRYPHQLSGGEQQRVALIRTLLMSPDLILADEAISALDVSLRVEMIELFMRLREEFNTAFLFISHDLANAKYITEEADGRIGIMYLGKLVEIGSPEQIVENPQHPYTKALLWATTSLVDNQDVTEPPIRSLDVPDPTDPPTGCRFHTRCPEAREACTQEIPPLETDEYGNLAACFRTNDEHAYWDSSELYDEDSESDLHRQARAD